MRKITLSFLGFCLLTVASSGCGLRDRLKAHKQQETDRAAERNAEKSREIEKGYQAEDAELAQKEFEIRRRYLYALEGDYVGTFAAVTTSPDAKAVQAKIEVRIQVQHDVNPATIRLAPTAGEIRAQTESMTLQFEVTEYVPAVASEPEMPLYCVQGELKPDLKKGIIRFVCPGTSSVPGRDYQFSLDDLGINPKDQRTFDNILPRSIDTSSGLVAGSLKDVSSLNLKIMTPYGKQFFGKLDR
ncbi:MAG: hypothetical protein JNL01_15875 [Bdellovibrionales bacterium]|nr:hypothetical protein [Bdellovibrionales bacterium]